MIIKQNNEVKKLFIGNREINKVYKGEKLIFTKTPDEPYTIEFIFNQTGEGEVVTPLVDTGLLDYLAENIKCYQGKYQEDGSMVVTEILLKDAGRGEKYQFIFDRFKYSDEKIDLTYTTTRNYDFFIKFPTIYYKVTELEPDIYNINFRLYPFADCLKVFDENNLIGQAGAWYQDEKGYANYYGDPSPTRTLLFAKNSITNRGKGYYCLTSDELGVLAFLNIYANGINGDVIYNDSKFMGITSLLTEGADNRRVCPNIELDSLIAKVTHNDGVIEYLTVPYIWSKNFSKLYITKYLNIIPKEEGNGIYNVSNSCWINERGTYLYYSENRNWSIAGDKNDNDSIKCKCRPCFKGKIVETEDVEYFKSLPIIN